jgi:predicted nucleotidyltransferase
MATAEDLKNKLPLAAQQEINAYAKSLRQGGVNFSQLILFGSFAKGYSKPWSDIDIGVVSPDFGRSYFDELVRLHHLRGSKTLRIDPHPFNPADLSDRWNPLAAEMAASGISLTLEPENHPVQPPVAP